MSLPKYFIDELKSRNEIGDVVSSYVAMKHRGKNLLGLCPFHNEKTPSFNVNTQDGYFHCFGCNAGGDVITFIMKIENLDYIEAVRFLAQRAGMQVPEDGVDDSIAKLRMRILEINRETARFYHEYMFTPAGKRGLEYFESRGLDIRTIRHFGLGYSHEGGFELVNRLKSKGYRPDELVSANVAGMSKNGNAYDRFKKRAMFPIIDLRGNVVAFGGRILTDEKPKYINTSDTPVYHKSSGLFAMNFAKDAGIDQLILAEGYMDVIALHEAGFTNAIASLGTSLTEEQARIIARYVKEVVICYDSDEAGQKATQRAIPILKNTGLFVKVITVPGNKDPDEFMRTYGKDGPARFRALLEKSGSDMEYQLEKLKSGFNIQDNDGKLKYAAAATELIAGIEDRIARDIYISKLAGEIGVSKPAVEESMKLAARRLSKKSRHEFVKSQQEVSQTRESVANPEKSRNVKTALAEEKIIAFLFKNQNAAERLQELIPPEKFVTKFNRRVYGALLGKTIQSGEEVSLSDFAGEISGEEMNELVRITMAEGVVPKWEDVQSCANIIIGGMGFEDPERVKTASGDELKEYFASLRQQKN